MKESVMKKFIKILFFNIIGIFAVIGFILVSPIILNSLYEKILDIKEDVENFYQSDNLNQSAMDSIIKNYSWGKNYSLELNSLPDPDYKDFIGWKYGEFTGQTLNIDKEGLRFTLANNNQVKKYSENNFLFFGGSAMWGYGVSDAYTIPSILSVEYNFKAINYAEPGYTSRQSLAFLINLYSVDKYSEIKDFIIFYDGYNDVIYNCTSGINPIATVNEKPNKKILNFYKNTDPFSFKWLIIPSQNLIKHFKQKINLFFNMETKNIEKDTCSTNSAKAELVANSLFNNWLLANAIAKHNGDTFIAILQPTIYHGMSHIQNPDKFLGSINPDLYKEFNAVYPIVKSLIILHKDLIVLDYTNLFYDIEIYIGPGHISPIGNEIFAEKFITSLEKLNLYFLVKK